MEVAVLAIIFGAVFGVFYLYFSTRNKERMALIEKGADASIFARGKEHTAPFWKVFTLNLALLLMGIGFGLLIASLLYNYTTLDDDAVGVAIVFITAGASLFVGFNMTKKLDD